MDRWLTEVLYMHNSCFMPTLTCCGPPNSLSKIDDECRARVPRGWLRRHRAHRAGDARSVSGLGSRPNDDPVRLTMHVEPQSLIEHDEKRFDTPRTGLEGARHGQRPKALARYHQM